MKKINYLLSLVLLTITVMVIVRLFNSPETEKIDLNATTTLENEEKKVVPPAYTEEQIKTRYEELKVERLITAMKSHHSRDVLLVVADGIDFDLINEEDYEKVRKVAQEENYLHIIKPLLKDN